MSNILCNIKWTNLCQTKLISIKKMTNSFRRLSSPPKYKSKHHQTDNTVGTPQYQQNRWEQEEQQLQSPLNIIETDFLNIFSASGGAWALGSLGECGPRSGCSLYLSINPTIAYHCTSATLC